MADDVLVNLGAGGVTFRSLAETSGKKWPAMVLSKVTFQSNGANVLSVARDLVPLPVCLRDSNGIEQVDLARVESSGFQEGITPGIPGFFLAVSPGEVSPPIQAGRLGVPRMSRDRDIYVCLRDVLGAFHGTSGNPIRITFAGITPMAIGDGGGSLTIDSGSLPLAFTGNISISSGNVTVNAGTGTFVAAGLAANGAPALGNPVLSGSLSNSADPSPAASGSVVRQYADSLGKKVLISGGPHSAYGFATVALTTAAASDILAAPGVGQRWVITGIKAQNSHPTVGTKVEIRDGTTVRCRGQAGPIDGGFLRGSHRPIFIGSDNAPITVRCVTTGADLDVTVRGYRISN